MTEFLQRFGRLIREVLSFHDPAVITCTFSEICHARITSEVKSACPEREALVFVGYSLSPYDRFARDRIRQFARGKQVEVWNPARSSHDEFRRLFGDAVDCHGEGFEESAYAIREPDWSVRWDRPFSCPFWPVISGLSGKVLRPRLFRGG